MSRQSKRLMGTVRWLLAAALRARTRTLRARRTIPQALAELVGDEARGIAADARALRSVLVWAGGGA